MKNLCRGLSTAPRPASLVYAGNHENGARGTAGRHRNSVRVRGRALAALARELKEQQ